MLPSSLFWAEVGRGEPLMEDVTCFWPGNARDFVRCRTGQFQSVLKFFHRDVFFGSLSSECAGASCWGRKKASSTQRMEDLSASFDFQMVSESELLTLMFPKVRPGPDSASQLSLLALVVAWLLVRMLGRNFYRKNQEDMGLSNFRPFISSLHFGPRNGGRKKHRLGVLLASLERCRQTGTLQKDAPICGRPVDVFPGQGGGTSGTRGTST